ncbi:MAG: SCO family protein [Rhodospirillales bacterium]|jgi:protein SCO1/2|nr:SCO family protein [Rhodospirillaceae bacterium]MDP6427139.1 SCO family protein [Rhodospirillales bacterium]MDP6646654.1 SCO family protein [Rhodospirillales bacterium]MDP6840935.1 SCO family protein [Rhodospirillales bacterium]|tara:strand:- start:887 stop:1543 length:657 start_codon:yes stop_codon:yes gene_type:complete
MPIRSVYFYFGLAVMVIAVGLGLRALVFNQAPVVVTGKAVDRGSTGVPDIGGKFSLIDHNGRPVSEGDFLGRHMLVFFGYTNCPDVCPMTLSNLSEALDKLGGDAGKIRPVFVSVDPLRDTPGVLKAYLESFHPAFIGLTGSAKQVAAVKRVFRIYSEARHEDGQHAEPAGDSAKNLRDYTVDHSSITYLMGPDGKFKTFVSHGTGADAIAAKLKKHL